jgi:phage replication-related protein YjqB (UPF0714/DUF867 family)
VVVAPHGGGIEQGTSEIAEAIAGQDFSLYCLEGTKRRGNEALHVTSTCFDDPECVELVERSEIVVTVHGLADSKEKAVYVGGLDEELKAAILESLRQAGFTAIEDMAHHSGRDPQNICNRGASGAGFAARDHESTAANYVRRINSVQKANYDGCV